MRYRFRDRGLDFGEMGSCGNITIISNAGRTKHTPTFCGNRFYVEHEEQYAMHGGTLWADVQNIDDVISAPTTRALKLLVYCIAITLRTNTVQAQ